MKVRRATGHSRSELKSKGKRNAEAKDPPLEAPKLQPNHPHYLQIPYSLKCMCNSKINSPRAFPVPHGQAESGQNVSCPTRVFPVKQNKETCSALFQLWCCKQVSFHGPASATLFALLLCAGESAVGGGPKPRAEGLANTAEPRKAGMGLTENGRC